MARSTLPEYDPLVELGIGRHADERLERPSAPRLVRPRVATKPEQILVGSPSPARAEPLKDDALPVTEDSVSRARIAEDEEKQPGRAESRRKPTSSSTALSGAPKAKTSSRIAADVFEEVRDCVVWHGHAMTIDSFTEAAFREHLKRLRREHAMGERFPAREREPKQGRRVA